MGTGLVETRTWNDVLTTTLANYRKQLIDNIFDVYPLLSWLNGKLGIAMRGASVKRVIEGGESIVKLLGDVKSSLINGENLSLGKDMATLNKQGIMPVQLQRLSERTPFGRSDSPNCMETCRV